MHNRIGRLRLPLIGLMLAGAVTGSARPAGSHGENTDATVVHACVDTKKGDVRVVGVTGSCVQGDQALHWGIVGPVGPQGPTGPLGPQGPQGPSGPGGSLGSLDDL